MSAFLGMRGTGDWETDQRPKNWREKILFLWPNGDMPLTGILSKIGEERVDDPEFNWWTKGLPAQSGAVTNIYTDVLSTAYTSGGVIGTVLYVKMAEALADEFRAGHQVLLRYSGDYTTDVNAKVLSVVKNGASSYASVRLLEADDNSVGSYDLSDCDVIQVIGNINPEGSAMPDAISYTPTKYYNYTQIFRTPLSISRTAKLTRLRTGDAYREKKREALQMHGIEQEKGFIWGIPTENTGANGLPERTTGGLIYHIVNNGGIVSDFASQTDFTDVTFLDSGEEWLDHNLEQVFRYGSNERLAFAGSGVILQINKLIKEYGNFDFTPKTESYGINVTKWHTPFGMINIMRHPLFSYEATNRNSMVVFDPSDLKYRYVTDTTFYPDPDKKNTGRNRIDGVDEEWLTECGLEFHHPAKCAWLNGFGQDNGTP